MPLLQRLMAPLQCAGSLGAPDHLRELGCALSGRMASSAQRYCAILRRRSMCAVAKLPVAYQVITRPTVFNLGNVHTSHTDVAVAVKMDRAHQIQGDIVLCDTLVVPCQSSARCSALQRPWMGIAPKPPDTLPLAPGGNTPVCRYVAAHSLDMARVAQTEVSRQSKRTLACSYCVRCLDGAERRQRSIQHPCQVSTGSGLGKRFLDYRIGAAWTPTASSRWPSTATGNAGRDVGVTTFYWCAYFSAQSFFVYKCSAMQRNRC